MQSHLLEVTVTDGGHVSTCVRVSVVLLGSRTTRRSWKSRLRTFFLELPLPRRELLGSHNLKIKPGFSFCYGVVKI